MHAARWMAALIGCAGVIVAAAAGAEEQAVAAGAPAPDEARALHALASASLGRGLRFNNPYRLATPLGSTAESVSLSATYLDLGLGLLLPAASRWEHGGSLDLLLALDGVSQWGVTPSYLAQFTATRRVTVRGRLGLPVVVTPDTTVGLEMGVGSLLALAYGFGVTAELVGSLFFGAATEQKGVTTIPMLALQMGVCFDGWVPW